MQGDNTSNELYKECLRNHAASLGNYATDGCGEFTLDDTLPPGSLQCAACGCHRNFHRKVTSHRHQEMTMIEYGSRLTLIAEEAPERSGKKRVRTKFSEDQKGKMLAFAEKLGWKMQIRKDEGEDEIERFVRGVGVSRKMFKVWMHNHKNSTSSSSSSVSSTTGNASSLTQ